MRPGLWLRLAMLALVLAALVPVQIVAARRHHRLAGRLPVVFHRILLRLLGIRVHVEGTPPSGAVPTLILSNHVSWLDIPVLASLAPLSFIAKSEIAAWPVIGALARLQRCVFIDRARKVATAEVNAVVAHRLAEGDAIVLFPEGTTGDGIRLLPFRSSLVGAARAALTEPSLAAIALQPVAIAYRRREGLPITRREMPQIAWYGDMDLAPHLAAFLRGGVVDVTVAWGEPIPFHAATDRKRATAAAAAAVRASMAEIRKSSAPHLCRDGSSKSDRRIDS
ncbi:lysophospholipid acyltransferase family protein [Enterovirga rhinocerotis]|uniref:Lyso-ornithine lipid acyltransferase n=1 Tax=Enterovirga rhinocerotis TaxID=1339210 RepID=A0A4R7BQX2_9HYPH|nr:lysophospholipid acyltransferase family protein [Enterovirga rhinocerotis]TDR87162.1 lyso-ornithine lipid acyltransferase [Enterovirga rhinocerotis]